MSDSQGTVIAIDGPAASGKSSVARMLARKLGYVYVNTGAMYRAVTWYVLNRGIDPKQSEPVIAAVSAATMEFGVQKHQSTIRIDGKDPEPFLCEPQVNQNVSTIATIAEVRQFLVAHQRNFAETAALVVEGRDIGSVVFPDTPYKFYIDASPEVRARRRLAQGLRDEIGMRDKTDSTRKASPLIIAEDAHVVDSSNLTVDGVVGEIIGRLKMKGLLPSDY